MQWYRQVENNAFGLCVLVAHCLSEMGLRLSIDDLTQSRRACSIAGRARVAQAAAKRCQPFLKGSPATASRAAARVHLREASRQRSSRQHQIRQGRGVPIDAGGGLALKRAHLRSTRRSNARGGSASHSAA